MKQNSVSRRESDQGNSNISSMEDSAAITIEFLRARLLTERSVSKAAKQRSDELAKRVLELEEQLKLVSLQRKKAEQAATSVLSILESRGVSEFSDEFDSGSELDETLSKSKMRNNLSKEEESSASLKTLNDDSDGSENVTYQLSGRSLSWRSGRDSSSSREKSADSSTRKCGTSNYRIFAPLSSRRRMGKSCRQIHCKAIRSAVDDSQMNGSVACPEGDKAAATCSEDFPLNDDIKPDNYREELEKHDLQVSPAISQSQEPGHESNKGMDKALKYQAQFIGKYEEEEKAQSEWEEKFRENNNHVHIQEPQDISDEKEKDTIEETTALVICSKSQEPNSQVKNSSLASEPAPRQPNCLHPTSLLVNKQMKESGECQNVIIPHESLLSDFSRKQGNQQISHLQPSAAGSTESSRSAFIPPLSIVPHVNTSELGSVLGALNQAKLSIQNNFAQSTRRPLDSSQVDDIRSQIPFGSNALALFRVPFELEYGTRTNNTISLDSQPRLTNYDNTATATAYDPILYRNPILNAYTENRSDVQTTQSMRPLARISSSNNLLHARFNQISSLETNNGSLPSMYYSPNCR